MWHLNLMTSFLNIGRVGPKQAALSISVAMQLVGSESHDRGEIMRLERATSAL